MRPMPKRFYQIRFQHPIPVTYHIYIAVAQGWQAHNIRKQYASNIEGHSPRVATSRSPKPFQHVAGMSLFNQTLGFAGA